jgi:hypothetical protein
MERRTTLFLKATVFLIGIPILALCILGLPQVANEAADHVPAYLVYLALIGLYGSAIPFFAALFQAFRLLGYIDKNKAFSDLSVRALKHIKYYAISISVLNVAVLPLIVYMADLDDAPGLTVVGLVIPFASMVIAVFAAVLQKLLQNAIDIKSENDLTI